MMSLVDSVINFLEEEFKDEEPVFKFYIDEIPSPDVEAIVLRHDPSQAKTRSFVDGTSLQFNSIGFYSRFSDKEKSRVILKKISNALDNLQIENKFATLTIEVSTQISFAYTDDKERAIYTFSANVESKLKQ